MINLLDTADLLAQFRSRSQARRHQFLRQRPDTAQHRLVVGFDHLARERVLRASVRKAVDRERRGRSKGNTGKQIKETKVCIFKHIYTVE